MEFLEKVSRFVGRNMAVIVLVIAALALFVPASVSWIKTSYVNTLLGIVMFGMGLTLKPGDFKVVFSRPMDILIGFFAQFSIMPLLAYLLTKVFNLPLELSIGVILVGTCPGGTASNVMTYLAKGDVPLSVGMTAVSTLLAPVMTPLLTYLYAGQRVDVNMISMFISIVNVVILPIVLGFIFTKLFGKLTEKLTEVLPLISVTAIVAIVAAVVSANAAKILTSSFLIIAVVVLHNIFGYLSGYVLARLLKMSTPKCNAVAIEVGMQNSGLATALAATHFATLPLATIPGAVFSVWHNISGSIVANLMAAAAERKSKVAVSNGVV
ncbi:MAG TPA: bile acid:sodium symporter family protein [Bacillota bacterium]